MCNKWAGLFLLVWVVALTGYQIYLEKAIERRVQGEVSVKLIEREKEITTGVTPMLNTYQKDLGTSTTQPKNMEELLKDFGTAFGKVIN